MASTTPCPQCEDNAWFLRVGIHEEKKTWHDMVVAQANESAKTLADVEYASGTTSLSWDDFWFHHFSKAYRVGNEKKQGEAISNYEMACYKKSYGKKNEKYICSYHGEFRYFRN
jgi:hypothetical protein